MTPKAILILFLTITSFKNIFAQKNYLNIGNDRIKISSTEGKLKLSNKSNFSYTVQLLKRNKVVEEKLLHPEYSLFDRGKLFAGTYVNSVRYMKFSVKKNQLNDYSLRMVYDEKALNNDKRIYQYFVKTEPLRRIRDRFFKSFLRVIGLGDILITKSIIEFFTENSATGEINNRKASEILLSIGIKESALENPIVKAYIRDLLQVELVDKNFKNPDVEQFLKLKLNFIKLCITKLTSNKTDEINIDELNFDYHTKNSLILSSTYAFSPTIQALSGVEFPNRNYSRPIPYSSIVNRKYLPLSTNLVAKIYGREYDDIRAVYSIGIGYNQSPLYYNSTSNSVLSIGKGVLYRSYNTELGFGSRLYNKIGLEAIVNIGLGRLYKAEIDFDGSTPMSSQNFNSLGFTFDGVNAMIKSQILIDIRGITLGYEHKIETTGIVSDTDNFRQLTHNVFFSIPISRKITPAR